MSNSRTVPMAKPNPPRLSEHLAALTALEQSGVYSNYGREARRLEDALSTELFGSGHCLSVCNATLGLMIAVRSALWRRRAGGRRRFAIMPSYTFAATAHAALWNGLTPLYCDIDEQTWLPSAASEEELLRRYDGEVALIMPCATFGNSIDMTRYERFQRKYGVDIVVDAAAALGSRDTSGQQFGKGSRWPIVFSMHATKPFASGEGGILYCEDGGWIEELRSMASFGFEQPRVASLPGINAKISEVAALTAYLQFQRFHEVINHREALKHQYRRYLPGLSRQRPHGRAQAHSYEFVLLPEELSQHRTQIMNELRVRGIGTGCYFSPHLFEQQYFAASGVAGPLHVTESVSRRVLTLPMYDSMTEEDVQYVASELQLVMKAYARKLVRGPGIEEVVPELTYMLGNAG